MRKPCQDVPSQAILLASVSAGGCASLAGDGLAFRLSFAHVEDDADLIHAVAAELMFPHEPADFDGLLDLMSDLDWFANASGYLIECEGVDAVAGRRPELLERFVSLLPNLCDRWRSGDVNFRLVLRCESASTKAMVRTAIDTANANMEKAAELPWLADLRSADVIECGWSESED